MGCDIHLYAEKKTYYYSDKEKLNGKWVSLDRWSERDEWEDNGNLYKNLDVEYGSGFYTGGRNYNLFTALAFVRSKNFDNPITISKPKGFPKDASKLVKKAKRYYGSDGHSHSFLTLKELKEFDWSSYGETCQDFLEEVLPKLEKAKGSYEPLSDDEVRIVFWFDN